MKITIDCNDEQANIIVHALEIYMRQGLGQWRDTADYLAFDGFNYKDHTEKEFDGRIMNRDVIQILLETIPRILHPNTLPTASVDICNVKDVWQVLRHEIYMATHTDNEDDWDVRRRKPRRNGEYDLPKVKVEVDE